MTFKNFIIGLVGLVIYIVLGGIAMAILVSPLEWLTRKWSEGAKYFAGYGVTFIIFLVVFLYFRYFAPKERGEEIAPGGNDNIYPREPHDYL